MPELASPVRALPIGEPSLRPLSPDGLARLHAASLRILGETGVAVGSAGIRDRLAASGARVDGDRVRLPAALVEAALAAAPRAYTLAAREPSWDLPLDGAHGYLSVDGSAAEILDLETGLRRSSTEADLAQVTRLADALPEIAFLWQGVEAGDRPVPVRPLHELRTQFANSGKHVQLMTAVTPLAARGAVELARTVAGGADALRARPILSSFQVSLSPLQFEGERARSRPRLRRRRRARRLRRHGDRLRHGAGHARRRAGPDQRRGPRRRHDPRDARPRIARRSTAPAHDDGPPERPRSPAADRRTSSTRPPSPSSPATTGCRRASGPSRRAPSRPTGRPAWRTASRAS